VVGYQPICLRNPSSIEISLNRSTSFTVPVVHNRRHRILPRPCFIIKLTAFQSHSLLARLIFAPRSLSLAREYWKTCTEHIGTGTVPGSCVSVALAENPVGHQARQLGPQLVNVYMQGEIKGNIKRLFSLNFGYSIFWRRLLSPDEVYVARVGDVLSKSVQPA